MKTILNYEQLNKTYNDLLNTKNRIPVFFVFVFEHKTTEWRDFLNS